MFEVVGEENATVATKSFTLSPHIGSYFITGVIAISNRKLQSEILIILRRYILYSVLMHCRLSDISIGYVVALQKVLFIGHSEIYL